MDLGLGLDLRLGLGLDKSHSRLTLGPRESLPLDVLRREDGPVHGDVVFIQSHQLLGRHLANVGEYSSALEGGAASARLLLCDACIQVKSSVNLVIFAHL